MDNASGGREAVRVPGRIGVVIPVLLLIAMWPVLIPRPDVSDNFLFWSVGHMVVIGESPYDLQPWKDAAAYGPYPGGIANSTTINVGVTNSLWAYPPQTAFLFAPFGALPYEIGVPLLHLFILLSALLALIVAAYLAGLRGA